MSRRLPIRSGPLPDLAKIVIPDRAAPVFQAKVQRMTAQLVRVLNQVDPPATGGPQWATKYNAKMFPDMILVRAPSGAGQPVAMDMLEPLVTASDWEGFARKLVTFLRAEAQDCMEQQTKSNDWHLLNPGVA